MSAPVISVKEAMIQDTVTVQIVDLTRYDSLYCRKAGVCR